MTPLIRDTDTNTAVFGDASVSELEFGLMPRAHCWSTERIGGHCTETVDRL